MPNLNVNSIPSGIPITIDGAQYTTPATMTTTIHSGITFNAVFCWVTLTDNDLHDLLSHQIYNLFLQTSYLGDVDQGPNGFYNSASGWSDAQITAYVDHIKAYDARFNIYLWLGVWPENSVPNITTYASRANIISAEVNYITLHHFDGIATDLEYPWGSRQGSAVDQNAFDFYNEEATAMHNIGKRTAPYIFNAFDSWQGNFEGWLAKMRTLTCDYIVLTEGIGDAAQWAQRISIIGNTVSQPVMESIGYGNLIGYISLWNDLVATYGIPSKLVGFAVYVMPGYVSGIEWATWDSWNLKNLS